MVVEKVGELRETRGCDQSRCLAGDLKVSEEGCDQAVGGCCLFKIAGNIGVGWDGEPLPDAGAISGRPQVSL